MVEKPYSWENGAVLNEHSRRKHKILREYLARYLEVRCQLPQQTRFRLAIVDGFAGGGRYACGAVGSPIIFIEELRAAASGFNLKRASTGMAPIDIDCLLILNDEDPKTLELLKTHVDPMVVSVRLDEPKLRLQVEYRSEPFRSLYPALKTLLENGPFQNVLFNLDQYGHSHVDRATLADISRSFTSAEIFYTFAVEALLAFLKKDNLQLLLSQLRFLGVTSADLSPLEQSMNKNAWLGAAERIVLGTFGGCAKYVSPFSIHNPHGWRYWLIHFSSNYRARQEYNNVSHKNATMQAHFGRSGLNMLAFDPSDLESTLYLFDVSGRERAKQQLIEDIPRLVSGFGDIVSVTEFYDRIYNMTPAHTHDVHAAIIENPDLEVLTEAGGERRKANTIGPGDTLQLKRQRSFFQIFSAQKTES